MYRLSRYKMLFYFPTIHTKDRMFSHRTQQCCSKTISATNYTGEPRFPQQNDVLLSNNTCIDRVWSHRTRQCFTEAISVTNRNNNLQRKMKIDKDILKKSFSHDKQYISMLTGVAGPLPQLQLAHLSPNLCSKTKSPEKANYANMPRCPHRTKTPFI